MLVRIIATVGVAFVLGKLVSKLRLPAILGWLLGGMLMGPFALNVLNESVMNHSVYKGILMVLECGVGLMIGSELVYKDLKETGVQIMVTTLVQSLMTFGVVTIAFAVIFSFVNIPIYVAFVLGGIALATAPAPALSIVREFNTAGPVTDALIPMAALDDIFAIVVFFSITSVIGAVYSGATTSIGMSLLLMIGLPIVIGVLIGLIAGVVLNKAKNGLLWTLVFIGIASAVGIYVNTYVLAEPVVNFMLIGMALSATFANMIKKEKLESIMHGFNPILMASLMMVIINLGAPLDYSLIFGAGVFTFVYIFMRAAGKYTGAYIGARMTKMDPKVRNYLGLTLLPHSGVSLVFTGIAATSIAVFDPSSALVIQGIVAAAAIINEIVAVILSKKAFEWAGEFNKGK